MPTRSHAKTWYTPGCMANRSPGAAPAAGRLDGSRSTGQLVRSWSGSICRSTLCPTREEFAARTKQKGPIAYHAKVNLERLDRGEKLPEKLPYQIGTWSFGEDLSMVFLAGEVVVDYALRLKKECPNQRCG